MVPSQNQSWMCQWFVSVGIWMCRTGINRYKLCLRSVNLCFYAAAVLSQPDLRSTCSSVYLNLTVCSSDHRCSFWWENSQLLLPQLFLILVMFPLLWLAEDTIKTEVLDDSDFQVFPSPTCWSGESCVSMWPTQNQSNLTLVSWSLVITGHDDNQASPSPADPSVHLFFLLTFFIGSHFTDNSTTVLCNREGFLFSIFLSLPQSHPPVREQFSK